MPFFSVLMPKDFQNNYPNEMRNLRLNSRKLTTPFDIHETLKDLLTFKRPNRKKKLNRDRPRSYSLFDDIPANRSCLDAQIEPHWCACLTCINVKIRENSDETNQIIEQKHMETYKSIVKSQINELKNQKLVNSTNFINSFYKKYENTLKTNTRTALIIGFKAVNFINSIIGVEFLPYCELLKLKSIEKLSKLDLNERLLSFKNSKDMHGREAVFEESNLLNNEEIKSYDKSEMSFELTTKNKENNSTHNNQTQTIQNTDITYQIVLTAEPGSAIFELSLKYNKFKNLFKFNKNEISRINNYNNTSLCMVKKRPDLRQFCYCKDFY
jgi:hypothetical protein